MRRRVVYGRFPTMAIGCGAGDSESPQRPSRPGRSVTPLAVDRRPRPARPARPRPVERRQHRGTPRPAHAASAGWEDPDVLVAARTSESAGCSW